MNRINQVIIVDVTDYVVHPAHISVFRYGANSRSYKVTRERIRRIRRVLGDGRLDAVHIEGLDDRVHSRCCSWFLPWRYYVGLDDLPDVIRARDARVKNC